MSDVFISYSRSSEGQATDVEEALKAEGYKVWRDAELPAHRTYAEVIEERLKAAKAVVALWSEDAARSQWVRAEADAARELGTLVQARLDGTIPPLPFNQIQCADLQGWAGEASHPGWQKLLSSIADLAGGAKAAPKESRLQRKSRSVCILPFQNMSGDAEQEYFSDGISEDITTDLSKVSALAVTARNTAFQFKGKSVDIRAIARQLRVSHVLEGSVRKAGNRVRINAQLIDGHTGDHVWADRYDRDLDDIFAIQDEISTAIVEALKVRLLPEEKHAIGDRCTCNPDAYNLYLMARNYWITGNHGDVQREERVIRLCQRAVAIDPDYATAWALLANALSSRRFGFGLGGDDGVEAAEKALSIDPGIAEAHCPIIRRYIEQRDYQAVEAEIEKALMADPNSWEVNKEAARAYTRQRKFQQAADSVEKCLSIVETDYYGWGMLISMYRALGNSAAIERVAKKAITVADEVLQHDPNNGAALSVAARARAGLGDAKGAKALMERGLLLDPDNLNMSYNFGSVYAAELNDPEAALALIEPALAKASGALIRWAEIDPDVDSLRSDARFESVLAEAKARISGTKAHPVPLEPSPPTAS